MILLESVSDRTASLSFSRLLPQASGFILVEFAPMIDACTSTFPELADLILPGYMAQMRKAMAEPRSLAEFCGVGIKTMLGRLERDRDFSGCYVLLRDGEPFYVGISRGVVGRLRQHGKGSTHFDASLAYRMACEKAPHEMTRDEAM